MEPDEFARINRFHLKRLNDLDGSKQYSLGGARIGIFGACILRKFRISTTLTKITLLFTLILLILAACNTMPAEFDLDQVITSDNPALHELENTEQAGSSSALNNDSQGNPENYQSSSSITGQFQTIYIDPEQVKIIGSEMVDWPDSCLGIEQLGVECIPENTPGYAVLLEARGLQFAYHSNEVGSQVHPATPGLTWTRDDDNHTVCDRLVIFLPDTANVCWCKDGVMHAVTVNLQEILSEEEYLLLIDSLTTFSENTVYQPSAEQANPVMVSLTFNGQGKTFPNANQQDSLVKMAELIFARIIP